MPLGVFERECERDGELFAAEKLGADVTEGAGGGDGDGQDFDGIVEGVVAEFGGGSDEILAADERPLVVDAAGAVIGKERANEAERKITASDFAGLIIREIRVTIQI